MTFGRRLFARACLAAALCSLGASCAGGGNANAPAANAPSGTTAVNRAAATPTPAAAETGVEKVKPAPGTGNVQGQVLYNGKPAPNIEVKLCEKFNQFFGGCSGKTFTAKTDAGGEYVITNVEPLTYESLMARVFDTDSYVFATTGIAGLSSAKYEVAADKTLFVRPTNLFKGDLKLVSPKAGSKVSAQGLELKWEAYPDAAYYKFSLYPTDPKVTSPYINERVEGTSFAADKPLPKGEYRWQMDAYNGADQKLSESGRDIKFTVTDGT
ncbi:MAG TPA: hypothetical protein VF659_22300 [Pyrinomonadaceae bacterium]|jgi:hypothetical protein